MLSVENVWGKGLIGDSEVFPGHEERGFEKREMKGKCAKED
jgi:hypothetical protein